MKKTLLSISIIILFSCNNGYSQKKDSIPLLKTYPVYFNPIQWQQKLDTLNFMVGSFGRTLTVDAALVWQEAGTKIINAFATQIREQMARDTIQKQKTK